jgi:hypothetical protein
MFSFVSLRLYLKLNYMHMKNFSVKISSSHVTVSRICNVTGSEYSVKLLPWQYGAWINDDKVTDFASDMTEDEREFLISGTTPEEWNAMWQLED